MKLEHVIDVVHAYAFYVTGQDRSRNDVAQFVQAQLDKDSIPQEEAVEYVPGGGKRVPLEVRYDQIPPVALQQLAEVNQEGDKKYGGMQYMKGMPYSTFVNHMFNHLMMYCMGDRSAYHMAKVAWGAFAIINMDDNGQALEHNDLTRNGPGVAQKTFTTDWFKMDGSDVPS
jgi:hypothetical protein